MKQDNLRPIMKAFIESLSYCPMVWLFHSRTQFSYCPMVWMFHSRTQFSYCPMVWMFHSRTQFSYCPMIWMFHSRTLNNKINELDERALRLVYKDHNSMFDQLLLRDKSYSIHDRNLQTLAIEMYNVKHNLSPAFMHTIFPSIDNNYNLREIRDFKTENIHTTYFGTL